MLSQIKATFCELCPVCCSSEQRDIPGLSSFMATALKVVSAPDAFIQTDKPYQRPLLPSFSFSKRGTLVKTMSRKHSIFKQASDTAAAATPGPASTLRRAMLPQNSNGSSQSRNSSAALRQTLSHKHSSISQQFSASAAAGLPRVGVVQSYGRGLAPIPEDVSVAGSTPRDQVHHACTIRRGCPTSLTLLLSK